MKKFDCRGETAPSEQQPSSSYALGRWATTLGVLLVLFASVLSTPVFASGVKIFDGKPKLIIYTNVSINVGGKFRGRIEKTLKGLGHDQKAIKIANFRCMCPFTQINGDAFEPLLGMEDRLRGVITAARSEYNCQDCPLIFMNQALTTFFISDTTDPVQLNLAVGQLEATDKLLKEKFGAAMVFHTTTPYGFRHGKMRENDPFIMREFNRRHAHKGAGRAIDVVTATYAAAPSAQANDFIHNNGYGMDIAAHMWLQALLDSDGLPMPQWSTDQVRSERDRVEEKLKAIRFEGPFKGRYKKGDRIEVKGNCSKQSDLVIRTHLQDTREKKDRTQFVKSTGEDWGAEVRGLPSKVSGGGGGFSIQVDDKLRNALREGVFKNWKHLNPEINPSSYSGWVPVILVCGTGGDRNTWKSSNIDFGNPEEMILIHVGDKSPDSSPIYPEGVGAPKHRAPRDMQALENLLNGIPPANVTGIAATQAANPMFHAQSKQLYDVRGKRVGTNKEIRGDGSRFSEGVYLYQGAGKGVGKTVHLGI